VLIDAPRPKRTCMSADSSVTAVLKRRRDGASSSCAPISSDSSARPPRASCSLNSDCVAEIATGACENSMCVVRTTSSRPRYDSFTVWFAVHAGRISPRALRTVPCTSKMSAKSAA
jgi:hypothetical protein